jgi:hypothetical protein
MVIADQVDRQFSADQKQFPADHWSAVISSPEISHNLVGFNTDQYLKLHSESRTRGSHPMKYQIPKAIN